jgi:uncharacterized phiE125 gp8 family phage protein
MTIPVTLEAAKLHLKIELDDSSQDEEVAGFIADAAAWIEKLTGHVLVARDVTKNFSSFDRMLFREWPIAADAVPTVTYDGAGGQAISVTEVRMLLSRRPARVAPWVGARWPALPIGSGVTATVRAGYEEGDDVPRVFRRAMLTLIAAYDDDREGGDILRKAEDAAKDLCSDYRIRLL